VIVIGAGQAGLCLSHSLQRRGIAHLVLERDRPFASWHRRWDSFVANTPNWMNELPPLAGRTPGRDPDGFATREELLAYFDACHAAVRPPIRTGVAVRRIEPEGEGWRVLGSDGEYLACCVAVCTGAMNRPRIPAEASRIPPSVPQLHSSEYLRPAQVPGDSVLLVGSGSSGTQICGDLCRSGRFREVHLAVSDTLVLPRHVLGIPVHRFLHRLGLFDVGARSWRGRLLYSGLETRGDPILRPSPRDLSRTHGVRLHGKLVGADGEALHFAGGERLGLSGLAIVWCTGFRADYDWIGVPDAQETFDARGYPVHERGVVRRWPGLYFVGLRYQSTVASHDLYGVGRDAEYVADRIAGRLASGGLVSPPSPAAPASPGPRSAALPARGSGASRRAS
jgi:putative flavoprotein involved in K+ transport